MPPQTSIGACISVPSNSRSRGTTEHVKGRCEKKRDQQADQEGADEQRDTDRGTDTLSKTHRGRLAKPLHTLVRALTAIGPFAVTEFGREVLSDATRGRCGHLLGECQQCFGKRP